MAEPITLSFVSVEYHQQAAEDYKAAADGYRWRSIQLNATATKILAEHWGKDTPLNLSNVYQKLQEESREAVASALRAHETAADHAELALSPRSESVSKETLH